MNFHVLRMAMTLVLLVCYLLW